MNRQRAAWGRRLEHERDLEPMKRPEPYPNLTAHDRSAGLFPKEKTMQEHIKQAVIAVLEGRDPLPGGFVSHLAAKDYAAAAFNADRVNLAAMGEYIKWREWLIVENGSVCDPS